MIDQEQPLPSQKKHFWRYLPNLIILGLAVYILLPQITTLEQSWAVVENMTWWAVVLAFMAETISWLGNGLVLHSILHVNHQKLSIGKGALIAIATLSISLVAGGAVGLAATIGWVNRESHDGNTAFLAGTLPSFLNNGVLVFVSMIGTAYLLFIHVLSKLQLIEFSAVLIILGLVTAAVFLGLRSAKIASKIVVWFTRNWASIRHKPYETENTVAMVERFFVAWNSLGNWKWLQPLFGAIVNVSFDMLAFKFMFIAAGHDISLGNLFAGYGFPLTLGKMAFLFPGGIGVVEGTMVAVLGRLQVPSDVSVVVIMGYRLISFWLPTLLGFAAAAYLSGRLFSGKKHSS